MKKNLLSTPRSGEPNCITKHWINLASLYASQSKATISLRLNRCTWLCSTWCCRSLIWYGVSAINEDQFQFRSTCVTKSEYLNSTWSPSTYSLSLCFTRDCRNKRLKLLTPLRPIETLLFSLESLLSLSRTSRECSLLFSFWGSSSRSRSLDSLVPSSSSFSSALHPSFSGPSLLCCSFS